MDNTEMINLALALLDQCGATKDETKQAAHFFADKLENVDKQVLWPLIDDSSN
jgi:alpha/beta superfamily hydrolase